ncbi:MAG: hypothetical protein WBA22_08895 [Candidatus Methanofastidiosia archaeon]
MVLRFLLLFFFFLGRFSGFDVAEFFRIETAALGHIENPHISGTMLFKFTTCGLLVVL